MYFAHRVAEDLEKGEFGKAAKAAFDWLFKSFKALIQPAPSPGMGKTVSSAGYSIATSYQTAIFLRNLIEVYKIGRFVLCTKIVSQNSGIFIKDSFFSR